MQLLLEGLGIARQSLYDTHGTKRDLFLKAVNHYVNEKSSAVVAYLAETASVNYFLTLYTQDVLHYSAIQSGFSFLPLTLSAFVGAKLINTMLTKVGVAGTIAAGMGLGAAGFLMLTGLSASGSAWSIIPGTVIIGIGQALVFTTMFIAGSAGIEPNEQGIASALISTGQQIGGAIGLAVIMAIISASLGTGSTLEHLQPADLNSAIHTAFLISAATTLLGILVAFLALKQPKPKLDEIKVTAAH